MLTENFIAATSSDNKQSAHISNNLRDVGIFDYEFQPQVGFRSGFKKSSVRPQCFTLNENHIFAAQAEKAVINVYNREKGNQEATVPFPDKIHCIAYAENAATLVIGTEDGKLILWEVATGRISNSATSHLQPISKVVITRNGNYALSASDDSLIHVWSIPKLLAFQHSQDDYGNDASPKAPVRTFSAHKTAIVAMEAGHSRTSTNFVVSASRDRTCYIWHFETCQILRTVFLPVIPLCVTLDPVDRAIYFGNEDGSIQHLDLFSNSQRKHKTSIFNVQDNAPIQISSDDRWKSSSEADAAHCITLSYDGSSLLSGHQNGAVIRWDVGKRKVVNEVTNLHQPVTALRMLRPKGLRSDKSRYQIPAIIKPRLDLNTEADESTVGIPASYVLHVQATQSPGTRYQDSVSKALHQNLFPEDLVDDALQAILATSAGITSTNTTTTQPDKSSQVKIAHLESELALANEKILALQNLEREREKRHAARAHRRDALGLKKREAYFAAKKKGQDGDVAMRKFEEQEEMIDVESEDEATDEKMHVDSS